MSTEEQAQGHGIGYTKKRVLRHFEKKGYEHVGTFADEGLSGSLEVDDRPELKRLMELARQEPRPFDMVGVNEGRAIGRTGRAFWRWVWELEDLGVYVTVVDGDYDNSTGEGRARMRDAASYAEKERELIRDRTQGGIQETAEEGMYPGGQVPFGWTVKDGRYVVARKAAATLQRGREVYMATRSWTKVALTWNSEGRLTATGKRWTRKNARRVMLSEATLNNRVIWRGRNAMRDADGIPLYGEQVTIKLPKILKKREAAELRDAAANAPAKRAAQGRAYLLTDRMTSPCGSKYRGHNHRPGVYDYVCKGRDEQYAGAGGKCACPPLDVDTVERAVWADACALLGDAERMKAMAKQWLEATSSDHVDHIGRIAQLDQQIAEQSAVIDVTIPVAARQAAKRGLTGKDAELAVEAAIKPLTEELASLERLRSEASAWQREAEQATQRLKDFERLAETARSNLAGLTPELRAELFHHTNAQAVVTSCAPKRKGVACRITDWFTSRDRPVPDLTDEAWAKVEHLLRPRRGASPKRPVLEALLEKARTGARFADLAERYGNPASLQTQANRWLASGAWDAAMELLEGMPGQPAWRVPPVEISVTFRPLAVSEFCVGDASCDPTGGWRRICIPCCPGWR
ncbi:recombinase family protein [Streptomyces sp. t39]|uniref:recombinase family protein n=1 Tax=Streptomyces sp. t39 TaxID=1828156 RepID=UPI003966EE2B